MNRHKICTLTLVIFFPVSATVAAEYVEIGPGLWTDGVSADGNFVVGWTRDEPNQAYIWSREDGLRMLGALPGHTESRARGVTKDGSMVVGWSGAETGSEVFLWTSDGNMKGIGNLPGFERVRGRPAFSADGSTVVGTAEREESPIVVTTQGFRWTEEEGFLGLLPDGHAESVARDVSADGTIVAVAARTTGVDGQGFRWDEEDGFQSLGSSPPGFEAIVPMQISADGKVLAGADKFFGGAGEAFRWTESLGIQPLQFPSGASVLDVSRDGSILVGFDPISRPSPGHGQAFVWDEKRGARILREVLIAEHGFSDEELPEILEYATGLSDDSMTVVGTTNPGGRIPGERFAWAIYLDKPLVGPVPEPATAWLLTFGVALIGRRFMRSRR